MNKRQKEVQQAFLHNEKAVLKKLEENYQDALFEINDRLERLLARQDADMQHVVYQTEYQKALKAQVQGILEQLHANEFETVSDYLTKAYDEGFLGTMYDIHGQGIPIVVPIDQEQVVIAIQHETKLSTDLYAALGKDTSRLSKQIAQEISRGISNAATYEEMTRNIASFSRIPRNNAARIARTEAHRIQNQATANAQWKAKEKGADVLKQWDAFLDGKTRDTHRKLDGQIKELDEPFEIDGKQAMFPADFGDPAEDCNCRCALLQRARWALNETELKTLQERAAYFELDKSKDFEDFKKKYMKAAESERVRSSAQKINEKRKTSEGIFNTLNNGNGDSIRPHSIMKDMKTSEVGTNALNYLQNEKVPVNLLYGVDNPKDDFGQYDPFDDVINVYCDKTKTIRETASTVIHEATHRINGNMGTFDEEVKCYEAEILHQKGKLTENDKKAIIQLVRSNYPELE